MTAPLAYAIDFGTTNTLLAAAYPNKVDVLHLDEGQTAIRSLLFLSRDTDPVLGARALTSFQAVGMAQTSCGSCALAYYDGKEMQSDCIQADVGGRCNNARLLFELKDWLADDSELAVNAWAKTWTVEELVAVFLKTLKQRGDRITGHDVRRAVIGHPVVFDGAHGDDFDRLQKLAATRLERAAELAGFEEIVLLDEPTAASKNNLPNGTVVAVDFGGGTFDVAVIRYTPERGELLALEGVAVGGEAYDGALLLEALGDRLGLNHPQLPNWVRACFKSRKEAISAVEGGALLRTVKESGSGPGLDLLAYILETGSVYKVFDAIEAAKIELSSPGVDATQVFVRLPVAPIKESVTLQQMQDATKRLDGRVMDVVDRALAEAKVDPSDVDLVMRTGGSSEMKSFLSGLEDRFSAHQIHRSDTASMVVQGLALHAVGTWGQR